MTDIIIQIYSPKSFVVKGDTTKHSQELSNLGGKWNSKLTDAQSGEKFGAWIFPNSKRNTIEEWLRKINVNPVLPSPSTSTSPIPPVLPSISVVPSAVINSKDIDSNVLFNLLSNVNKNINELNNNIIELRDALNKLNLDVPVNEIKLTKKNYS